MVPILVLAFLSVTIAENNIQNGFLNSFSKVLPQQTNNDSLYTNMLSKVMPTNKKSEVTNTNNQADISVNRNIDVKANGNTRYEKTPETDDNNSKRNGFLDKISGAFGNTDRDNENKNKGTETNVMNINRGNNAPTAVKETGIQQTDPQNNNEGNIFSSVLNKMVQKNKNNEPTYATKNTDTSNSNVQEKNNDQTRDGKTPNTNLSDESNSNGFLKNLGNVFGKTDNSKTKDAPETNGTNKSGNDSLATSIGKGIQTEIQAVLTPIDETLVSIGSSQCKNVKKIFGVTYEQLEGDSEPDLAQLSLHWSDGATRVIFNITEAARTIPAVRGYNPHKPLIIFVHGFTDDPTKTNAQNIIQSFQDKGECNVLSLDASPLIKWLYLRSTTYVQYIGKALGTVLAAMVQSGVDPAKIHMIGHSLGSHISGFTGKTFANLTGYKVGRISGLDPAGPCFSAVEPDYKLKASDADFVDVMHTDAGVYGLKENIGHVDFYANSGQQQPNCLFQTCSHSRAVEYFAESIVNPEAFPSYSCKDWDQFRKGKCNKNNVGMMGYPVKPGTKGQYYLQTNGESPYGRGQNGLKFENNEGVIRTLFG